ncbi:MAG: rod shape-determining protein MreC [Bacilli bacterium]|nr:rod shape-determining protein MreC [Bacilli bacterium]
MKKNKLKFKTIISVVIGGGILSLLFFSLKYNFNISFILKDILYFPITVMDLDKEYSLNLDSRTMELEKELDDLKNILNINSSLTDFEMVNATVINRNVSYWNEELIINKGKNEGIKEGMAVMDGSGLIGRVIKTSLTTSTIKLITSNSNDNKISVKIWCNNDSFNKVLEQDENNNLIISGVDNDLDIKEGDLVTTSGLSDIYPSGITIGSVEKITYDKFGVSKKVFVKHSGDLENIRFVAVLKRGI